jgi:hypothetical protein
MPQTVLKLAAVLSCVGFALPAQAATLTKVTVDFSEYAFPQVPTVMSGTQNYNLFDDATGAKLIADNGDGVDFSFMFSSTGADLRSNQNTLALDGKSIVSTRRYIGSTGVNNPGTLISNTATLRFFPQWNITDLQAEFTSINTAGTAWEYAVFSFLKPDGTPFSAAPTISHYLDATSLTDSPSPGWYVASSKDVVQGVGTSRTSSPSRSPSGNLSLTYALAGLVPNTPIGGLTWTTYLEDTRGTQNRTTNSFIASWESFTVSGKTHADTTTPVPTPALLPGLISLGALGWRRGLLGRRRQGA